MVLSILWDNWVDNVGLNFGELRIWGVYILLQENFTPYGMLIVVVFGLVIIMPVAAFGQIAGAL